MSNSKSKDVSSGVSSRAVVSEGALISGNVRIADGAVICPGAVLNANDGVISIGSNTVVLENAVIRASRFHDCRIGSNVMIGPNSHISGCTIENEVFVATGVSVFNGAVVKTLSELRINSIVHVDSLIESQSTLPIAWIAVGNPAKFFPPDKHDELWELQKTLNFPKVVFGLDRDADSDESMIKRMTDLYSRKLAGLHRKE